MLLKGCSTLAAVLCIVGLSTATANAEDLRHIDELAIATRGNAANVANELRYYFRGSRHYKHLYRDAYDTYALADHVHEVVHTGDASHLREDLAKLDKLFHHLEEMIAKLNADYGFDPLHDDFGHDHFHGSYYHGSYHLVRLNKYMKSMSVNLHHLQEDVDKILGPVVVPAVPEDMLPGEPIVPGPGVFWFDRGRRSGSLGISLQFK